MNGVLKFWGVSEAQLQERVNIKGKGYSMICIGRSTWKKKTGRVGVIVRHGAGLEAEMNAGICEMSEDTRQSVWSTSEEVKLNDSCCVYIT